MKVPKPHHLIYGTLNDYLTGEELTDTDDERIRQALARAFACNPAILFADEPTGNLDPATATRVMEVLVHQARRSGSALVLVTHSQSAAALADRVLHLREGRLFQDEGGS